MKGISVFRLRQRPFLATASGLVLLCASALLSAQARAQSEAQSLSELEYGTVLFEYFQGNHFEGLVEQAARKAQENPRALSHRGHLLEGSMALSYGLSERAQTIFDELLADEADPNTRNRAWYYLAKLYHSHSKPGEAFAALQNIRGEVPADLHLDYRYLSTLVSQDPENLRQVQNALDSVARDSVQYPYLLFNLGVSQLSAGNYPAAVSNLTAVVNYGESGGEYQALADRARHGLAQIAMANEQLEEAWTWLRDIRTEGLYSNRALLAYAWTAIQQNLFDAAIPALQVLKQRSVALPEVQQGIVLLGHVYEQQGANERALKALLDAEAKLQNGLNRLADARRIADDGELPRELSDNLEAAADLTDWEAAGESEDYRLVAPFLVDLMAGKAFRQVNQELTDLYSIRDNLAYWERQTEQHDIILQNAAEKVFNEKIQWAIYEKAKLNRSLINQGEELALLRLTLDLEDQARLDAVFDNAKRELEQLDDKIELLQRQGAAYRQPPGYVPMVAEHHQRISQRQQETESYIARLEPVMRNLVQAELSKHEERMRYYLAQARLAKARLYDAALSRSQRDESASSQGGSTQ